MRALPSEMIDLDAVPTQPAVSVAGAALTLTNFQAPLDIDFGDVAVGETRTRRFTLVLPSGSDGATVEADRVPTAKGFVLDLGEQGGAALTVTRAARH